MVSDDTNATDRRETASDDETVAGYDVLAARDADGWATPWADNPLQELYSWPATRDLLPDLGGERVLDAGCGVGDHAEWFLDRGADVVGVDASEGAVERARERLGDRASFHHADLGEGLPLPDDSVDVVCSHLVLDHLPNLDPAFEAFHRVLRPGGVLVFTVVHPMQFYLAYEAVDTYYDRQAVELGWDGASVTSYHRPVGEFVTAVADAGFRVETVAEPRPADEYLAEANDEWCVDERPQVLCVRAAIGSYTGAHR